MKFTDSLVTMVGDFAAMKRTPDYRPSSFCAESASTKPEKKEPNEEEIPTLGRQRSESMGVRSTAADAKIYNKLNRRGSAPSTVPTTPASSLRKKLQKLREKSTDSDDDTIKEVDEDDVCSKLAKRRISSGSVVYRI
ncbi:unnamed protein product [Angiostrongylus costaricensis]|uniref:Uncharacterized protein n=1 Tax=Angiostrongylus costaricensis TaxID=334426 RepID=A0A158PEL3_ANGCS|nr:unnamed protein product [Angiostrongylus costaricensis]